MSAVLEAEQGLIGCILFDNTAMPEGLAASDFQEPFHQAIWAGIQDTVAAGRVADAVVVANVTQGHPASAEYGGVRYLMDLMDKAPPSINAGSYADAITAASMRRRLDQIGRETIAAASDCDLPPVTALAELERAAADLGRRQTGPIARAAGLDALDMLESAWNGDHKGHPTGLFCFDRITGGIQPDAVWIVGARTSMGKSVVLPNLGRGIAQSGRGVLFFSLEMPRREVQARLIADLAHDRNLTAYGNDPGNIRFSDILKGQATAIQRQRAESAAKRLASLPITISDKGGLTLDEIISEARRQVRAWERAGVAPGAILIDHIGLVRSSGTGKDSKAAEVSNMVDRLKDAAKRIGAPIIAAAQLNRNAEQRTDHKPLISDLNWSGSIEQIADLVALLYRPAYYLARSSDQMDQAEAITRQNELEIAIPKNRSGPTCAIQAYIDVACNAVRDVEEQEQARRWG